MSNPTPAPDVPVTDADRAVVRDYHRQPGRKGESNDQQLARLVAERVHAATAALQGEVERLTLRLHEVLESFQDTARDYVRPNAKQIQAEFQVEVWTGKERKQRETKKKYIDLNNKLKAKNKNLENDNRQLRNSLDKKTAERDALQSRVAELERENGQLIDRREHVKMTKRSKHVLWLADDERKRMGHTVVGTEHLLLGLMREHSGVATNALKNLGLKLETVREEVLRLLGVESNCPETPDSSPTPVERASVLGKDDDLSTDAQLISDQCRDVVAKYLNSSSAPVLPGWIRRIARLIDRLQAALAERDEDETLEALYDVLGLQGESRVGMSAINEIFRLQEQEKRPQVVAPVGSFVPTGEVRCPKMGEWYYCDGTKQLMLSKYTYGSGYKIPIYRRIDEPCGYEFVIQSIVAERERQKSVEGWTLEHDDTHKNGELALAAACYASRDELYMREPVYKYNLVRNVNWRSAWPWDAKWDKRAKHSRERRLIIAGALIVAELERLSRCNAPAPAEAAGDGDAIEFEQVWKTLTPKAQELMLRIGGDKLQERHAYLMGTQAARKDGGE